MNRPSVEKALERIVSLTLRAGLTVSALLLCVGLGLSLLTPSVSVIGTSWSLSQYVVQSPAQIIADPAAWLLAGICVLMFTPVLRVLIAATAFAAEKDWRYVLISSTVLAVLAVSVALAWMF